MGQVTDSATGNPIDQAKVVVGIGTGPGGFYMVVDSTYTDASGNYVMDDVPVIGQMTSVVASKDGYVDGSQPVPRNPDDTVTIDFALAAGSNPVTGDTSVVSGTVTDSATGDPIENAIVVAFTIRGLMQVDTLGEVTTDANGDYQMTVVTESPNIIMTARASNYYSQTNNQVALDSAVTVDFVLTPNVGEGKVLEGTVTDTAGDPLEGVLVEVFSFGFGSNLYFSTQTDASGQYSIIGIPVDVNSVRVTANLNGYDETAIDRVRLPNDTTVEDIELTSSDLIAAPAPLALSKLQIKVYPTPAQTGVHFIKTARDKGSFEISVFSVSGKRVYHKKENKAADNYSVFWNGNDINGNLLPSGTYLYEVRTGEEVSRGSLILVR
jgi:hypothetical protein